MPVVAVVHGVMCAYMHRDTMGPDGRSIVIPAMFGSPAFAAIERALADAAAHELTLHHEDGTHIPTTMLGLQDSRALRALASWTIIRYNHETGETEMTRGGHQSPDCATDRDDAWADDVAPWTSADDVAPWTSEEVTGYDPQSEPPPTEWYQVHLLLAPGSVIP